MVCLLNTKSNKAKLAKYAGILGSEEAAYYVLAANNGYTLDKTPAGEPSALYAALQESTGSDELAVLSKAIAYTPQFFEKNGDWTQDGKEPSIKDINGDYITDGSALSEVLEDNGKFVLTCQALEDANILDHTFAIEAAVGHARDEYSAKWLEKWLETHKDANQYERRSQERIAKSKWNIEKIGQLMGKTQERLAAAFGLEKTIENGRIVYKSLSNSIEDRLRIEFVNSLTVGEYADENGNVHQGMFATREDAYGTMGLILIALEDADPTAIVHELGHAYLRKFWNSSAVQNALRAVDISTPGRLTSRDIEEVLVEDITNRVMKGRSLRLKFMDGWRAILKMLHLDKYAPRQGVRDLITSYFIINKDLSNDHAQLIIYSMFNGPMYASRQFGVTEKDVFVNIVNGLKRKLKALRASGAQEASISLTKQTLNRAEHRNPMDSNDVKDTVADFLDNAIWEIAEAELYLSDILHNGLDTLDPKQFMNLYNNTILYYKVTLNNYIGPLTVNKIVPYLAQGSLLYVQYQQTTQIIQSVEDNYKHILNDYVNKMIDDFVDETVDVGDRDRIAYNMKLWVRNEIGDGKLQLGEIMIGGTTSSRSPIVRMVEFMVSQANTNVRIQTNTIGHKLQSLYDKCKPAASFKNFMETFIEKDSKGRPTGYFLRDINYGQFYADKQDFIKSLDIKYNVDVDIDDRGEEIRNWSSNQQWKDYQDELDDWLDLHSNRKYTAEYYKDRRKYMSKDTLELLDDIQNRINEIHKKCAIAKKDESLNTGIPYTFELSSNDRIELQKLNRDKELLANPYIIILNRRGEVISLQKKSGDALRMAEEIIAYKKATAKKRSYTPNFAKYQQVELYIIKEYGVNSQEMARFKWEYLSTKINPELWDIIGRQEITDPALMKLVTNLQARRRAILDVCYDKKGEYVLPNLSRLNDLAFAELKSIDEQLVQISKTHPNKVVTPGELTFAQVFGTYPVMYDANAGITYILHLEDEAKAQLSHNPNALKQFYDTYYYTDTRGAQVPLNAFFYIGPAQKITSTTNRQIKSIIDSPIGPFNEIDNSSYYRNADWDPTDETSVLPLRYERGTNKMLYDNSLAYNETLKDKKNKAFYDELLTTMDEAYKKLPHYHKRAKFLLPLMEDKDVGFWAGGWRDIYAAIRLKKDKIRGIDDDIEINPSRILSPAGTPINMIPIRWNRLNKNIKLNTDILYTVIAFGKMAAEYEEKSKIAPMIETIILAGKLDPSKDRTEQTTKLESYVDMLIYDNKKNPDVGIWAKRGQLALSGILKLAHMKLMSHNLRAITKNLADSTLTAFAEIAGGKYFTSKDFIYALGYALSDILKAFTNTMIASPNSKSKLAAAMQFSGASETVDQLFLHQKNSTIYRLFKKFFCMGEYTLVDYLIKGVVTAMVYHHHRLVKNPVTGKDEFMTQDQVKYAYTSAGLNKEDGSNEWSNTTTTLWDVYTINEDGDFILDSKYEDTVRPKISSNKRSNKLETRIAGTIRERSSVINGVLDGANKGEASRNYFYAALMQMRGWMITHFFDYYKDGHDFAEYVQACDSAKRLKQNLKGSNQYIMESEDFAYRGLYNFETGTIERGAYRGIGKAYARWAAGLTMLNKFINTEKLTDNEAYQIRRLNAILAGMALAILGTFLAGKRLEKDKDSELNNFLYTVSVATVSERSATIPYLHALTALDVIKTPVIAITLVQDAGTVLDVATDALEAATYNPYTANYDAEYNNAVTHGSYKGVEKWQKDVLKFSSEVYPYVNVNNLYKSISKESNKSSANYYRQIFPTSAITYKPVINNKDERKNGFWDNAWKEIKHTVKDFTEMY